MMSIYTSAILTTTLVAGLSIYSIQQSKVTPTFAQESETVLRTHVYAHHKGLAAFPPVPDTVQVEEIGTGPFFPGGQVRSFLRTDYDTARPVGEQIQTAQVTWYVPRTEIEARRVIGRMSLPEDTRVGVFGEDGSRIDGVPVPNIERAVPLGAVVIVTEEQG